VQKKLIAGNLAPPNVGTVARKNTQIHAKCRMSYAEV